MKDAMCLMLLAGVLSAVCDGADPVDVSGLPEGVERVEIFLLMGQSNMKGRGELYENAVRRAGKALADFPEGKARVAGALWLQGESDSREDRFEVYSDKLTEEIIGKRFAAEYFRLLGE